MASITLTESAKLTQNALVAGVIETVVTTNAMFEIFPFDAFSGNALAFNRENVLGDVQMATVGDTITAKGAATVTNVTVSLTKIIGDAEVDGLIQATRSDETDQTALQIASKAKSMSRQYQNLMINGTGIGSEFLGLRGLCAASQKVATGVNGSTFTFELLDELLDLVKDKDGQVDYIMMNARELRRYKSLLRGLGGTTPTDVFTMPSGVQNIAYNGIPIFRNDYIPINTVKGSATNASIIFAGTLDDGSRKHGIAGLTAANAAGMSVVPVGQAENKDEEITRLRWYCSMANFSQLGLACIEGIIP